MKIDIKIADEHGIETSVSHVSNFETEEDYAEFIRLVFLLLVKNGADVPKEIKDYLDV